MSYEELRDQLEEVSWQEPPPILYITFPAGTVYKSQDVHLAFRTRGEIDQAIDICERYIDSPGVNRAESDFAKECLGKLVNHLILL
jgi:hypothetical protein